MTPSPSAGRRVEEADRERLVVAHVGHAPRLGGVGDIAVGQQHDRGHVAGRDPARLDRAVEGVGGRARGDHRHRRVGVAAVDRLIEVRLLGLGRQAGRRPAALRIDDDQRKLGHDREADRLDLERDARPGRGGDAELAGIARADRRADRGDLVLRLEGRDPEFLEPREMVEQRARRGDRIGAEEHLEARELAARDQAERERLGAGDGAVEAGLGRRRRRYDAA